MGAALPIISLASTVIGTGLSVAGQARQAQAQADQANYMAQVARRQQELAERNARFAEQQGAVEEDQSRLKTAAVKAAQRARLAAQGGDINVDSPSDIIADTARAGEFDVQTIRSNTAQRKFNALLQGNDAASRASAYDVQGANALAALPYGIGSSLLGAASSLARKWDHYR
jgi:hypothetical protein